MSDSAIGRSASWFVCRVPASPASAPGPTSNDLLESLIAEPAPAALSDQAASSDSIVPIVAESAEFAQNGVENIEIAPAAEDSSGVLTPNS
jgi:hypothetical protein